MAKTYYRNAVRTLRKGEDGVQRVLRDKARTKRNQYRIKDGDGELGIPPGSVLLVLVWSMLGLVYGPAAEAIDRLMARGDELGPVSLEVRKRRWDASAEYRQQWRCDVSVRIINELGRTIGYSISRALHAAGIPHGDDLFFATWGNSLDAIESEIAAARFLGGRLRGDVAEHEPMDRCLYNGQMRPGALGPPASWHDESDDVGTTFNDNNKQ